MKKKITFMLFMLSFSCQLEKKEQSTQLPDTAADSLTTYNKLGTDKEVVCFVYHRFGDNRYPSTNVSIADFETHLAWLVEHNYQVLTLSDAIDYLASDRSAKKTAVITIDDGYKSFFENGMPILAKYNLPATLFINTETVGAGDYMDWSALKNASNKHIEIGNHTHSHAYFLNDKATSRYTAFVNELKLSQKIIEENLNLKPIVFAYPYGEFDEEMKTIVKAIGFKGAAAQNSGVIDDSTDMFQLPRFPMSEAYADKFEEKALKRSMAIIRVVPDNPLIPKGKNKPILQLTIKSKGLKVDQMQCFVQGSSCQMNIDEATDSTLQLTLQATTGIANRRRTLYTLTAPDSAGNWHWFSHLWINPLVK